MLTWLQVPVQLTIPIYADYSHSYWPWCQNLLSNWEPESHHVILHTATDSWAHFCSHQPHCILLTPVIHSSSTVHHKSHPSLVSASRPSLVLANTSQTDHAVQWMRSQLFQGRDWRIAASTSKPRLVDQMPCTWWACLSGNEIYFSHADSLSSNAEHRWFSGTAALFLLLLCAWTLLLLLLFLAVVLRFVLLLHTIHHRTRAQHTALGWQRVADLWFSLENCNALQSSTAYSTMSSTTYSTEVSSNAVNSVYWS